MQTTLRILIIRFSSIGDIILTTPIIRCLKNQLNSDIDFLIKNQYSTLLHANPNINKIIPIGNNTKATLELLRSNKYDIVIDLQNNFRSLKFRLGLGVKSYTYSKQSFKRYVLIYFGIDLLKNHIVDRYFEAVSNLKVYNDDKGIDFFIKGIPKIDFNVSQNYICWCIGAAHNRKKLSALQISRVISKINFPVVLLGGDKEKEISIEIIQNSRSKNIYDFCGETTIEESAYIIKKSQLVLTNDTGMMHIASAFSNPIISFWGCTKPSLGFGVYNPSKESKNIITSLSKRPCSKHGKYCRVQSKGCIKEIDSETIFEAISNLLK